ncbi:molecular chaperone [Rahnella sp. CFA14(1/10)]|uniref:fimbrial biogenesis chaperone n=1 Tax=Rahnella sp. CFA14(1/10) TaxID=2511203 RepID=UPI0010212D64|nr:molecular chaperone [Rahnella sp. CFA14(1/10)]
MKISVKYFITCLLLGYASYGQSAVDLDSSRVIYHAENDGEDSRVKNNGDITYLVQSWVDKGWNIKGAPFTVTPPIFKLEKGNESKISVIYTGKGEASDRESLYWLNVKSIPALDKKALKNKVVIAVSHRVKLIYRPEGLPGDPAAAIGTLEWTKKSPDTVHVKNNSPYYVTLSQVILNGKKIPISLEPDNSTLAPNSAADYSAHTALGEKVKISWWAIGDTGTQSKEFVKNL